MTKKSLVKSPAEQAARKRRMDAAPRQHFTISLMRHQIEAIKKALYGPSCADPVLARIYDRLVDLLEEDEGTAAKAAGIEMTMATDIKKLREEHAVLVREMIHWEAEQVALSDGRDRDYAARKYAEAVKRAAVIKQQIAAGIGEDK